MHAETLSHPVNPFGFRLLTALSELEQERQGSLVVAPPAAFLGLALLKSAAAGATRRGLVRLLGTDETLSEEERERRARLLHETATLGGAFCLGNVLTASNHWPLSPSFLRRAASAYGVQLAQDDSPVPLCFRSCFQGTITLAAGQPTTSLREGRLRGLRFSTPYPQLGLYCFQPDRVPFWQSRAKSRELLLSQLTAQTWPTWHAALRAHEPGVAYALPALDTSTSLDLRNLDLGPASTAAADFSRLVVSGNAPSLSAFRHQVQLSIVQASSPALAPLPDQPLLWLLSEESTGVILTLGLKHELRKAIMAP